MKSYTVADFLTRGGHRAEEVLFLTPSKEAATRVRTELFERLRQDERYAASGSPVRSVHSWAFAVYRAIRQQQNRPLPRLITGAEHDALIQQMLQGQRIDGNRYWPEEMVPALPMVGFARQLRDVVLRATERGIGPAELCELGEAHGRPMWVGAGRFMEEFAQIQRLSGSENLNASELLHAAVAAVDAPGEGRDFLLRMKQGLRLIVVDDAHNLDPAAAQFVENFFTPGTRTLIAGDPDQCVFHFRGADEAFLSRHAADEEHRVVLSASHRLGPAAVGAVTAMTAGLPAVSTRVPLRAAAPDNPGELELYRAPSVTAQGLYVADVIRRAHVAHHLEWDRIAVIVRGTGQIAPLRRVLLSHGVPVTVDPTSTVLAEQPLVRTLLLAAEASMRELSVAEVDSLLASSIGEADPMTRRRVERAIARALAKQHATGSADLPRREEDGLPFGVAECLAALVNRQASPEQERQWTAAFGPRELGMLESVHRVLDAGRQAYAQGRSVEMVLWEIWEKTKLSASLQTQALRGGTAGSQADQDLDAVMSLFDMAGDFVERNPSASLGTFLSTVRAQELPTGGRDRRGVRPGAVEILPAHAAAGREWDLVCVVGVQEDSWPAGPTVGGLFGQQELVDLIDRGISPDTYVSRHVAALHEERRLFLLALSRARQRTVVTAVDSPTGEGYEPSRFVAELAQTAAVMVTGKPSGEGKDEHPAESALPRVLALEPVLAEMRHAVRNPHLPYPDRQVAAQNLAQMGANEVYGALPHQWLGALPPSTADLILDRHGELRLSPSGLEALANCPFQVFMNQHQGVGESTPQMRIGIAVHAVAEAIIAGLGEDDAVAAIHAVLPDLVEAPSEAALEEAADRWEAAVRELHRWITKTKDELEHADPPGRLLSEHWLTGEVGQTEEGTLVRISGRADLIAIAGNGEATVYDFKTGNHTLTKDQAAESPQLASYQFALALQGHQPAGAALVYPAVPVKSGPSLRRQNASTAEEREAFAQWLLDLAPAVSGPVFRATPGKHCERCDLTSICPAQPEGKAVV
ncbi:ATP-dependent DNA helicase [Corynebacterium heidelbergense]|uniref:DNA 3'-5' helicase n=1 Tax=Corynebacterium heidelbergense TaxID=2055947 RepID=A0A364V4L3_9CORY|nr:ATP-dependent DNA helicase [Corynebacterium heidelbergense]RAV31556.1 ATP-dependent helicase [Corynebacterium heidelbergense]